MKLKHEFYRQPTLQVAQSLIGKFLVHKTSSSDAAVGAPTDYRRSKVYTAEIIETEAYCGFDDLASHASRGKTPRNAVMFGKGGFSYVYLIYGIYHCLNLVTEKEGFPAAVLIRALDFPSADGPGKLCREFKITKAHNGLDVTGDKLYVEDRGLKRKVISGKRIGVDYAGKCADWPWRFWRKI